MVRIIENVLHPRKYQIWSNIVFDVNTWVKWTYISIPWEYARKLCDTSYGVERKKNKINEESFRTIYIHM